MIILLNEEKDFETASENQENETDTVSDIIQPIYAVRGGEVVDEAVAQEPKKNMMSTVYECVETFCYALAVIMVLFLFVFRLVSVDGDSMRETLHNEDKLIISNLFYTPKTGDIVVINPDGMSGSREPIIKRVIATGGQKVYIDYDNWEVYVDGKKLDEPYIQAMREQWGEDVGMNETNVKKYRKEFVVEEGKVFVMGDNRNNSSDSRDKKYGEMGEECILGRVIVRLYPNFGFVE